MPALCASPAHVLSATSLAGRTSSLVSICRNHFDPPVPCAGFPNRLDYHSFLQTYTFTRPYFTRHARQHFVHRKVGGDAAALERRKQTLRAALLECTEAQIVAALESTGGHAGRAAKQLAAQSRSASAASTSGRRASRRTSYKRSPNRTGTAAGGLGSLVTKDRVRRLLRDVFKRA